MYRKYVRIKGGQTKCVLLRTRGEEGLILVIFVSRYNLDDPLSSKIFVNIIFKKLFVKLCSTGNLSHSIEMYHLDKLP